MSVISSLNKLRFLKENGFAWVCYIFICGLFFSRAGLAISGVLLFLYAIFYYLKNPFKISLKPVHFLFFTIYAIYIFNVLCTPTENDYGLQLLFKNAIFVVIPLAFIFSNRLADKTVHRVLLLCFFLTLVCVSINTVDALLHFKQFLEDVRNSKNIVPIVGPSHSELGVLSAVAFVSGFYLAIRSTKPIVRTLFFCALVLLFVELNIIAYRFSLIAIYFVAFCYGVSELVKKRDIKLFGLIILVAFLAFYVASLIPSVKNRIQNTVSDFSTITQHKNPNFQSVTQRILAVDCSYQIIKKYPWFGVSPVNASEKMQEQYAKNSYLLIPENRMFIHNQFVYYVLCFGIPLGLLIGLAIIWLILKNYYLNPLLFWVMLPFLLHMMMENTLERQITANGFVFLFFILANKKTNVDLC